jgi:hypothetical protein
MMSINQATNLSPQLAAMNTGLEDPLTGAPQFWQKAASSVNCAPQFLQYGIVTSFSLLAWFSWNYLLPDYLFITLLGSVKSSSGSYNFTESPTVMFINPNNVNSVTCPKKLSALRCRKRQSIK